MKYPPGNYDEKQVRALTNFLNDVCADLGISPDNQPKREWVAMVLMVCSKRAPFDHQALRAETVRQFQIAEVISQTADEG